MLTFRKSQSTSPERVSAVSLKAKKERRNTTESMTKRRKMRNRRKLNLPTILVKRSEVE